MFVNLGVFKENLSETIWYIGLNFSEITENCYALSIFRTFILLASSDNDKPMLMRQKMYTRIFLYWKALVPLVNFCVGTKIIPTKASVYTRERCQLGSVPRYGVV